MAERFGDEVAHLVTDVRKLLRLGTVSLRAAQSVPVDAGRDAQAERRAQIEALRKMLLAFAQDIRVVLIRLASRLQSLRHYAAAKIEPPPDVARETLEIYAPLANRLGIWQLKWGSRILHSASKIPSPTSASRSCSTRSASSARRTSPTRSRNCNANSRPRTSRPK
nr:HD domain-containing protein [Burkholderia thailandensis]